MKLNEKTLLFILVVLLILFSIYYNKKIVYSNNNKFLLLGIIISLFVFFHKFTNGRIEKFYKDQYENFNVDTLIDYYNKNIELRDSLLDLMSNSEEATPKTQQLINYYNGDSNWDTFMQNNPTLNSLNDNDTSGELQSHHDTIIEMINNILSDTTELTTLEDRRTAYLESVQIDVSQENSIETLINNKKNQLNDIIQSINPPSNDTPSNDTPSNDEPSNDEPSNDTPSNDTPSNDTPSNDTPSTNTEGDDTTPTMQYLKKLFLNKSQFHSSSPTINMLNTEQSLTSPETNNDTEFRKTQLNFYNLMNNNTNTDNTNSFTDIFSGDTSINDLFQYNYSDVDDLLDNVNKRNYNFNISPVDFNIPIVNADPNSTETGSPNPDDPNSTETTNENADEKNLNNIVNDITQEPNDETDNNVFSSITYNRRINHNNNDDSENTENNENNDDSEDADTNDTQNNLERQSIYNTLFGDVQQDEQRDGINYYVNKFFSSVQDLFN